ncbi:hypothetical protein AB4Z09_28975 [Rhodococcus sp. TAF43]
MQLRYHPRLYPPPGSKRRWRGRSGARVVFNNAIAVGENVHHA